MMANSTSFKKGHEPIGGKRGPGKFTTLKQSFLDAFNSKEMGGTKGLIEWAMMHRNKATFYQMIAKMLPKDIVVDMDIDGELVITRKIIQGNGKDET